METFFQDVKFGIRMLLKNRGFTVVAVVTLALGIGANTAIFSVVNGVLLRPFGFRDSDRVVLIRDANPKRGWPQFAVAPANYLDWKKQATTFEDMAAAYTTTYTLTGDGDPERIPAVQVEPQMVSMLGLPLIHGRGFAAEENEPGKNRVVILSYGLWLRRFGGDPAVVGKQVALNGVNRIVVGVLERDGSLFGADILLPTPFAPENATTRGAHFLTVLGRVREGKSIEEARVELQTIAARLEKEYPQTNDGWTVNVRPIFEAAVGNVRPALLLLWAAVAAVLLIASVNVANLMLSRTAARQREVAVRVALGAGRWRLFRQFLTESVMLSLLGGTLGVLVAWWGVSAFVALKPPGIPRLSQVGLHPEVLLFSSAVALLSGVLFGIAPALQAARAQVHDTLKEGGRGASGPAGHRLLRNGLLVSEVAFSLALLVSAGLLVQSFLHLQKVDTGFDEKGLLTVELDLPSARYPDKAAQRDFTRAALERLRATPGVEVVAAVYPLPFTDDSIWSFEPVGRESDPTWQSPNHYVVTPDYFRAMRIPLVLGRLFTDADNEQSPRVTIINQTAARRFFRDDDPIGARVRIGRNSDVVREIVGIVADVKHYGLESSTVAQVYEPLAQDPIDGMTLVARTAGEPLALSSVVKSQIWSIDRQLGFGDIRSMEQVVAGSVSQRRFTMLLLSAFGVLALILAATGVYGVLSYGVSQRTAELGIRRALGAQQSDVLRLILGQGMKLVTLGVVIGLALALSGAGLLREMLFGVQPRDPVVFAAVAVLLVVVAMFASYVPARRAARVDPMVALRYE